MSERREHKRFFIPEDALAVAPDYTAQILDISVEGMSLWLFNKAPIPQILFYDILLDDANLNAKQVPVKLAWERKPNYLVSSDLCAVKFGVQFGDLSANQKARIDKIIIRYSDGSS
jgi:hypothetical protein